MTTTTEVAKLRENAAKRKAERKAAQREKWARRYLTKEEYEKWLDNTRKARILEAAQNSK